MVSRIVLLVAAAAVVCSAAPQVKIQDRLHFLGGGGGNDYQPDEYDGPNFDYDNFEKNERELDRHHLRPTGPEKYGPNYLNENGGGSISFEGPYEGGHGDQPARGSSTKLGLQGFVKPSGSKTHGTNYEYGYGESSTSFHRPSQPPHRNHKPHGPIKLGLQGFVKY